MKKLYLFLLGINLLSSANSQIDCDSLKCPNLADSASYIILEETVVRESSIANPPILISCEMRCAIEEARSPIEDVIFYWGTLKILIYKRDEIIK